MLCCERKVTTSQVDLPNVAYYLGALIVTAAMVALVPRAWEPLGDAGIFLISTAYALFGAAGVFFYLRHLAYGVFNDSLMLPLGVDRSWAGHHLYGPAVSTSSCDHRSPVASPPALAQCVGNDDWKNPGTGTLSLGQPHYPAGIVDALSALDLIDECWPDALFHRWPDPPEPAWP